MTDIAMPQLGLSKTDKAVLDVESPEDGVLLKVLAPAQWRRPSGCRAERSSPEEAVMENYIIPGTADVVRAVKELL